MLQFTILALLVGFTGLGAPQTSSLTRAPKAIQDLARAIQGKSRDQVRQIIVERFGPAVRNVGSGVSIEEWDIESGVLEYHMFVGPAFRPGNGQVIRLLETHNPAYTSILGNFGMSTLPLENGTQFWLGTLHLDASLRYRFKDSGTNKEHRGGQRENFFIMHPTGSFEIQYASGYTGETFLETVPDGTVLCRLVFKPMDGSRTERYAIVSKSFSRRELVFQSDGPMACTLSKLWNEFEK